MKEKRIVKEKDKTNLTFIIPSICFNKYRSDGKLYVDVGIVFLRRFLGFNILVGNAG